MALDHHAALAERNDQQIVGLVIAGGLPVMAAFRSGAGGKPLIGLLVENVLAIGHRAGLVVDIGKDVLEYRFLRREELAGDAVQLPQDAGLADGHQRLLVAVIDQHPLEHFVQVQAFARGMLEIPFQLAVIGIQRQGGTGIERGSIAALAAGAEPGLGLRHAPIGRVEIRIIGARDPGIGAAAQQVGQVRSRCRRPARLPARWCGISRPDCRCRRQRR